MEILIMSRKDAEQFSHNLQQKTAIISITDVNGEDAVFKKSENIVEILRIKFDDVTRTIDANHMTSDDAKKIISFVKKIEKKVELLIVHCQVGISRSAAVAAVISKYINGTDRWVFESDKYRPNAYCYILLLDEFRNESII